MGWFWDMQITGECSVCYESIHKDFSNAGHFTRCTVCSNFICVECFDKCLALCYCKDMFKDGCIEIEGFEHADYAKYYCKNCITPLLNEEDKASCFFKNFERVLDIETGKGFLNNKINYRLVEEFVNSRDFKFDKENFMEKFIEYAQQKWITFEEYNLVFELGNGKSIQRMFKCPTKFKKYVTFLVADNLKGDFIRDSTE
jgi:hypothetical protein